MTKLGPYAAIDHVFTVDVEGDNPDLERLFAPLESDRAADTEYRMAVPDGDDDGWIELHGDQLTSDHLSTLHHRLLVAVGVEALASTDDPVLHGCLVEHHGLGVLIAGRSGAGKSTLTARLLARGAALVTEDLTVVLSDGAVRPYPRPVALGTDSLELLGLPIPDDDCGCGCMKYAMHPEELGGRVGTATNLDVVVLCDRSGTGVEEIALATLITELFEQASIGNIDDDRRAGQLAGILARARLVVLGTGDLDAAVTSLEAYLDAPAPATTPVDVAAEPLDDDSAVLYLDGEALILGSDGKGHHLDPVATAVWVLRLDGLDPGAIATELECGLDVVEATLAQLDQLELPEPVR